MNSVSTHRTKQGWRGVGALATATLVALSLFGCSNTSDGGAGEKAAESEPEITMADWAPETDMEAGELLTSFDADGVTVDVYQVAVIPAPEGSGEDYDGNEAISKGDDVAVLNLVFTNTADPIDIRYIMVDPIAYRGQEKVDVETLSLEGETRESLEELGLSAAWTTVKLDDDETVTFEPNTRAAKPIVMEYVPDADVFMKVNFSRPTVAEEAELASAG